MHNYLYKETLINHKMTTIFLKPRLIYGTVSKPHWNVYNENIDVKCILWYKKVVVSSYLIKFVLSTSRPFLNEIVQFNCFGIYHTFMIGGPSSNIISFTCQIDGFDKRILLIFLTVSSSELLFLIHTSSPLYVFTI